MLAAIAEGETCISNFSSSADCHSTLGCLRSLGVKMRVENQDRVKIQGCGLRGLQTPIGELDAGNSGSTLRMLSGILSGQKFESVLVGDTSLSQRPMQRIIEPLSRMGARIEAREQKYPPLRVQGSPLHGISYDLPVPSAQVKSAILFAGLLAEGKTEVTERIATRNHTEIALQHFGVPVEVGSHSIGLHGGDVLRGRRFDVPGDISSAAFWVAAGVLVPEAELILPNVGLNATRIGFLELIKSMGGNISFLNYQTKNGEPCGDLVVRSSEIEGAAIEPAQIPSLIDEIPILGVLGAKSRRGLAIRGAHELRVKESDRISGIVGNLRAMGAEVEEFSDGFHVKGNQKLHGAEIDSFNDHRLAMAFTIAALVATGTTTIHKSECVKISFPNFFEVLQSLQC